MSANWTFLFSILAFLIKSGLGDEDLLDQYVRHVGLVNLESQGNKLVNLSSAEGDGKFNFGSNRKLNSVIYAKDNNKFKRSVGVDGGDGGDQQWTHSEYLDENKYILLKWQLRHQEILFKVEAKTLGYVGIGFSPNGGMEGADIIIGWVDNEKSVLLDCHGVPDSGGSAPVKDEHDNYTLMKGQQNGTHTILEFRRALDTCDPEDYILTTDTVRVIWALHDNDPHSDFEMIYHGEKRGSQSLHLFGPPPIPEYEDPQFMQSWDVILNDFVVNSAMDTIYWCKIFKGPALRSKHHIVGYSPVIGRNHSGFVHHMLLHECEIGESGNPQRQRTWETYTRQTGTVCYSPEMPIEWEKCTTPVVAWAVGSKGENFPKHVGLPLDNDKTKYYMLEVHFDNPNNRKVIDSSGIRLKYTNQLREHDGGIIATGITISDLHVIPPLQKEYKSIGYCSTDCTRKTFPKDGINVVSVLLHSHLAGRKLKLRHLRGHKELTPLAQDDHYDFDYQQSRTLSHEIKVLPGDSLVTECTYSTIKRSKPTFGGYSTNQEMCLAFILHYPKTELAGCYSMPPIKTFFETFGVREFYNMSWTELDDAILRTPSIEATSASPITGIPLFTYKAGDEFSEEANARAIQALKNAKDYVIQGELDVVSSPYERLIIKEPLEFQNKSFLAHLQNIPYDEPLITKKIEERFHKGLHLTFCRKRDDTLAIRENVEKFPDFTEYEYTLSKQSQCSYPSRVSHSYKIRSSASKPILSILSVLVTFIVCDFFAAYV